MNTQFNPDLFSGKKLLIPLIFLMGFFIEWGALYAQTAQGELEARPAPVFRRICQGGANAGDLCNQNGDCPGSTCPDRNVFNITVAVLFNATNAQLTTIQNMITNGSAELFDATDGQAEFGLATIYNNAFGTGNDADLIIRPASNSTGFVANTGNWKVGGSMIVSIDRIMSAGNAGEALAHEFIHLAFDARDEYESRAVGCGAIDSGHSCPDADAIAAGAVPCLMDNGGLAGDFSELCWGQGDPSDPTDLSAGNHDATNVTEQSRCRNNRSCWAQIVWSWPNTFLAPVGAPDPAANGATVNPTQFIIPDNTMRIVLVLDESGSMDRENPMRIERLQVAARDFIALAENGTEVGIVSYSDNAESGSGHASVPISALGANRSAWNNAIDGLNPDGWTNIGDGLQKARDMITAAGGVTTNTAILLMTDGINNRPSPQATADADLQDKIDDLMDDGIPVFVTCTGGDLGLSSQCSEIATGTGGFYVDSSDPAQLAEAFVDIHERMARRDKISSFTSWRNKTDSTFYVEEGSESTTFTLVWQDPNPNVNARMHMIDPSGAQHQGRSMPQGQYVRVFSPIPGNWQMVIEWTGPTPNRFVKRGYSRNPIHSLAAGIRHATVLPGEEIYVYAYPKSFGGFVTDSLYLIKGTVIRPDGTFDQIELNDMGRLLGGGGDDLDRDGIFTGVYKNTNLKGSYQFILRAEIDGWEQSLDNHEHDTHRPSAKFSREVRISGAVGDPNDVEPNPEDTPEKTDKERWPWWWCLFAFVLGFILGYWLCWYFQRRG